MSQKSEPGFVQSWLDSRKNGEELDQEILSILDTCLEGPANNQLNAEKFRKLLEEQVSKRGSEDD